MLTGLGCACTTKIIKMIEYISDVDDDLPRAPNPLDDSLSSPQSRRYWRELVALNHETIGTAIKEIVEHGF